MVLHALWETLVIAGLSDGAHPPSIHLGLRSSGRCSVPLLRCQIVATPGSVRVHRGGIIGLPGIVGLGYLLNSPNSLNVPPDLVFGGNLHSFLKHVLLPLRLVLLRQWIVGVRLVSGSVLPVLRWWLRRESCRELPHFGDRSALRTSQ